jgi:hypothetical protein
MASVGHLGTEMIFAPQSVPQDETFSEKSGILLVEQTALRETSIVKPEATSSPIPEVPIVADGPSPAAEPLQNSAGPFHSPCAHRPHPEPAPEPPALRWLLRVHRGSDICWNGVRRCAILAFLLGLPFALFSNIGGVFLFFLAIAALFGVGYVLLLTFFFSKYSLGQFIRVLMVAGLGVSLVVELEDGWKILPGLGLIALFAIVPIYVGSYDPVRGNRVIPRAAREMLFNPPDAPKPSKSTLAETDGGSRSA